MKRDIVYWVSHHFVVHYFHYYQGTRVETRNVSFDVEGGAVSMMPADRDAGAQINKSLNKRIDSQ